MIISREVLTLRRRTYSWAAESPFYYMGHVILICQRCFPVFFFNFRCEKQQVCVWADGQELADAPLGRNQLCRRLRSVFIFGLY